MIAAKNTPTGGPEAEALFQQAVDHHLGRNGCNFDLRLARALYAQALRKGNAKAALNLGNLYKTDTGALANRQQSLRYMVALFNQAASMGCPDGFFCLHEAFARGLGVPKDPKRADHLLRIAATKGSLVAMVHLGNREIAANRDQQGKKWLIKALNEGYGDAGYHLASFAYAVEQNIPGMIVYLRTGCRHGSAKCIRWLAYIYEMGQFGQPVDTQYAGRLLQLLASLDPKNPPQPIFNFDALYPSKATRNMAQRVN